MAPWLNVVGIGEEGLAGLGDAARAAIASARTLFGGARHLAMIPARSDQERLPWPSPFSIAFDLVLARRPDPVCILASNDPMLFGMGASFARRLPAGEMRVLPAPSSFSLAAARLGWPLQDAALLTIHGRPLEGLHPHLFPGARLLILAEDGSSPAAVARLLTARGFGPSRLTVLEHMGGPSERGLDGIAARWDSPRCADLNLIAVECRADADATIWSRQGGLPDAAFRHDGQLTKRDVRAATLARLAPLPGQRLWDVGAGCGSVAIEWMRSHDRCHAVAIEAAPLRQDLIAHNRCALGVPGLDLVRGTAPDALVGLPPPDAVFIGGGLTVPGTFDLCWQSLPPGGRLVANAVTLQSEAMLLELRRGLGGTLTRLQVATAEPLGGFDGWRPAMPVTLLELIKPA
jgi:precorrin-6Y C5,15-methyltransferase (decarboxylating)